jgi:hypothetical protein
MKRRRKSRVIAINPLVVDRITTMSPISELATSNVRSD